MTATAIRTVLFSTVLVLGGCTYPTERLERVHVGQCGDVNGGRSSWLLPTWLRDKTNGIAVSNPDGSIRAITWSAGESGLPCETWNTSTFWTLDIQQCNGGGYHLNWARGASQFTGGSEGGKQQNPLKLGAYLGAY
jgi:hypothetical protein